MQLYDHDTNLPELGDVGGKAVFRKKLDSVKISNSSLKYNGVYNQVASQLVT